MLSKKVFKDLAVCMIGFGVVIGVVFPFFVAAVTHVPDESVLNPIFFSLCIAAGFLVGLFNIFLAKKVVGSKMRQLSDHMKYVENRLIGRSDRRGQSAKATYNDDDCADENCYVTNISHDEIGDCAKSFNSLVKSLSNAFKSEAAVRKFTEMLSSRLELDPLAEDALSELMQNVNASGGAIIIERDGELIILSSFGIKTPETLLESDVIWQTFKNQKRLVVELPEDIVLSGVLVEFRPKSVLIEPIIYKGIILGVILLAGVTDFTGEMQNDLELYGQGLALALKNAITHDQLQKLAANDALTGLFNRRFGLTRLKDEFSRAIKINQPVGLIMFDIDFFKKVNDTYGHLAGDRVLIKLSQTVKSALRDGDVFMRYGGEEFLIILPGASCSNVIQIAEKVRRFVEDTEISYNTQTIKVTVSLGGTSFPEQNADDFMSLIAIADAKMYQAKASGRNIAVIN